MPIKHTKDDRELWKWLDEHVMGWTTYPSERVHALTQESWNDYVEEVKSFVKSLKNSDVIPGQKDAAEYDSKFLETVKPLYWPANRVDGKWGPIRSKSR